MCRWGPTTMGTHTAQGDETQNSCVRWWVRHTTCVHCTTTARTHGVDETAHSAAAVELRHSHHTQHLAKLLLLYLAELRLYAGRQHVIGANLRRNGADELVRALLDVALAICGGAKDGEHRGDHVAVEQGGGLAPDVRDDL